ncbi:uncharacterized protein PV09_09048 [Verruconis gallopava]|uniref:nitric-oxide synthase (NADPH) n=1 Tax=Verruconis gallopava TaxID=253628 RepID=A0A0D1XAN5_9PEZI|nr:uncharacterized protein PV09_09048 [Verruconis gallopava]KIV99280.1 hypothetical protein PV09_09048 [Verruconis gallopava]
MAVDYLDALNPTASTPSQCPAGFQTSAMIQLTNDESLNAFDSSGEETGGGSETSSLTSSKTSVGFGLTEVDSRSETDRDLKLSDHYVAEAMDGDGGRPPCLAGIKIYAKAQQEFERIRQAHRTLAPTGCTPQFCQSGRMTRTNETRVGRDRPLAEIQQEATDFLRECRDHGVIESDEHLQKRIDEALAQILDSSIVTTVTDVNGNQRIDLAGGTWHQTTEELEYGLRAAWRNSRRCIMRSEHQSLTLYDFRNVHSSHDMARAILDSMVEAFNRGHILPSAFIFPARLPGKRGPMVWNHQILAFAGYRMPDGSVLGDPANEEITNAIIKFGWKPPVNKSRWDLLPLVVMAENDKPCMMEIPLELQRTVRITHPRYQREFKELDLRWVLAPALSRLGFDIGGNQYTASPFIGWFMDAEIGIRNLADTFRYNSLPAIVQALSLSDDPSTPLDELPEYKRLVALSRAQAELNFAVYYSYMNEQVTMTDSLTSSMEYQNYDEEYKERTGFSLPADPYWIAPPQGSIISLWHRGGLPNYQPKPLICKHVQDPVKAWTRESPDFERSCDKTSSSISSSPSVSRPTIQIFFCSAGVSARKMATKLHATMRKRVCGITGSFDVRSEQPLNKLDLAATGEEDIIFIISSTTGRGAIPPNAQRFIERYQSAERMTSPPRFSCFGNGDSTYGDTYNASAKVVQELMVKLGCRSLFDDYFSGDTAVRNPDWESFNRWTDAIDHLVFGAPKPTKASSSPIESKRKNMLMADMPTAMLVRKEKRHPRGLTHISLNIGDLKCHEIDHIKILPPNPEGKVAEVLDALHLKATDTLPWHRETARDFFSKYVDLDEPFKTLSWCPGFDRMSSEQQELLRRAKARDVLTDGQMRRLIMDAIVESICKDMSSITPRLYSVASCPEHFRTDKVLEGGKGNVVDIMVKVNPGGRFSDTFLQQARLGDTMRFSLASPDVGKLIRAHEPSAPLIAVSTGSGIGPVRAILQRRFVDSSRASGEFGRLGTSGALSREPKRIEHAPVSEHRSGRSSAHRRRNSLGGESRLPGTGRRARLDARSARGSISLFAGFKDVDSELIEHLVQPAARAGLLDIVELTPSNPEKKRVQDRMLLPETRSRLAEKLKDPSCVVFVCANEVAAEGVFANLSLIAGEDVKRLLGDRYVEEVFRD